MVAAANFRSPPKPDDGDMLAPEDDGQISVAIFIPIDNTISKSDRELLLFMEEERRVLADEIEICDVCVVHHVLSHSKAPKHVDIRTVHKLKRHRLIDIEFDDADRMYLTATATLSVYLHPKKKKVRRG